MRYSFLRATVVACCCLLPAGALAADTPITLADALRRALDTRPELRGFAFELQSRNAQLLEAAQRPVAEAELLIEDFAGSGAYRAGAAAQTTLSLSRLIELGGKRDGRRAVAQAALDRTRSDQAARQLDVAAEVARSFVALLAQQARVEAGREALALAERSEAAVGQRVRAAAAPEAEHLRARVATAQARLELEDAVHDLDTLRHALSAAIGLPAPDFGAAQGELLRLDPTAAFDELSARLQAAPDFLRFADDARLRDAELRMAERRRRADLRASVGLRRYEAEDDMALVAGVAIPLFSGARAQPQIDAARAERERVDLDRDAAFLKARQRLHAQYQELEHARHVAGVLRDDMLPLLQQALEQTEYAWRRGRYSYLEWAEAQRRLLEARSRLIDTAADFHDYRIDIERLTGESLASAGELP